MPHATTWNTVLGLGKQVLWQHGTPERTEPDKGTHFQNNLIDTWIEDHGIEWLYHIPICENQKYSRLLKPTLRAMGGGTFKQWDAHLAKATWAVSTRGSASWASCAQSKLLHSAEEDGVPVMHRKKILGKRIWVIPMSGKDKPIHGLLLPKDLGALGG